MCSPSTCRVPGPGGSGVHWMPPSGINLTWWGDAVGLGLPAELTVGHQETSTRTHTSLVRAQWPPAGECPLVLPPWALQLDFGKALLWLGVEDSDPTPAPCYSQRPPHCSSPDTCLGCGSGSRRVIGNQLLPFRSGVNYHLSRVGSALTCQSYFFSSFLGFHSDCGRNKAICPVLL